MSIGSLILSDFIDALLVGLFIFLCASAAGTAMVLVFWVAKQAGLQ